MLTAYSHLLGIDVDSASEAHRHECECRWLLANKPTKTAKHLYLYGVTDRQQLFGYDKQGRNVLREDHKSLWQKDPRSGRTINPLMHWRGLDGADRLLADARRLYELQNDKKD